MQKTYKPYRCHQCIYFRETEDAPEQQGPHECIRYPPNSKNKYSAVMTYDWCGEGICYQKPELRDYPDDSPTIYARVMNGPARPK